MYLLRILLLLYIALDFASPLTPGVFSLEKDSTEILHRDRHRKTTPVALPVESEPVRLYLDRPTILVARVLTAPTPRPASWTPVGLHSSGSAPPADAAGDDH